MRFSTFLIVAAIAYAVDIPSIVLQFCQREPFAATLAALVLVAWYLAFAPHPTDRRWNLILLPLVMASLTA